MPTKTASFNQWLPSDTSQQGALAPPEGGGSSGASTFQFKQYQEDRARAIAAAKLPAPPGAGATAPAIKTGGWNDTRNDINADGKYLLFSVPDFKPGMTSYLRLGAACSSWESALGNELEKFIHLVGPQGKTTQLPFIDDERARNAHAIHPGQGATLSESAILHTKGGWRDHSDGNRITTTYGDKIEIIRGSYKLIILGRQDDPTAATGWDASGQQIQDWGYTSPGGSVTSEFLQEYPGGNWLLKNSVEDLSQWNRSSGSFKEEFWGQTRESYIGQEVPSDSEAPSPPFPGAAVAGPFPRNNPAITEKTFALSITSQTGSAICPVPTIDETTWVTASTSTTNADSTTDTTIVTGAITESTTAGSTSGTTSVSGEVSETTTVGGAITETTTVGGAITSATTVGGAITDVTTVGGAITEVTTVGGAITEVTTAALVTGLTTSALHTEIELTALKLGFTLGAAIEITAALKLALELGVAIDINLAETFELAPFKHEIHGASVKEVLADINNTTTETHMGGLITHLAGLFNVF